MSYIRALGIATLRNAVLPIGSFALDNDQRFHTLAPVLHKIAAITLFSTWDLRLREGIRVDNEHVYKLQHMSHGKLHCFNVSSTIADHAFLTTAKCFRNPWVQQGFVCRRERKLCGNYSLGQEPEGTRRMVVSTVRYDGRRSPGTYRFFYWFTDYTQESLKKLELSVVSWLSSSFSPKQLRSSKSFTANKRSLKEPAKVPANSLEATIARYR